MRHGLQAAAVLDLAPEEAERRFLGQETVIRAQQGLAGRGDRAQTGEREREPPTPRLARAPRTRAPIWTRRRTDVSHPPYSQRGQRHSGRSVPLSTIARNIEHRQSPILPSPT